MAHLNIYLDEETKQALERVVRAEKTSISAWVKNLIIFSLDKKWPPGYFELAGSVQEGDLERPEQLPFGRDVDRETL